MDYQASASNTSKGSYQKEKELYGERLVGGSGREIREAGGQ